MKVFLWGLVVVAGGTDAGSWSWRESAEPHVLHNGGTTLLIIYEIDWR